MHEFLYLFPWWHTDEDVNQKGCYSEDEWACVLEHTKQELPVNPPGVQWLHCRTWVPSTHILLMLPVSCKYVGEHRHRTWILLCQLPLKFIESAQRWCEQCDGTNQQPPQISAGHLCGHVTCVEVIKGRSLRQGLFCIIQAHPRQRQCCYARELGRQESGKATGTADAEAGMRKEAMHANHKATGVSAAPGRNTALPTHFRFLITRRPRQ